MRVQYKSTIKVQKQVAETTMTLASVDEMVSSSVMVIMHRAGIAKRSDLEVEREVCDLVKGGQGNEVVLEMEEDYSYSRLM